MVDFVSLEHRLVVEVDGGGHSGRAADTVRNRELRRLGLRVVRFWNHEVLAGPDAVLERIRESLTTPSPCLSRKGRGAKRGARVGECPRDWGRWREVCPWYLELHQIGGDEGRVRRVLRAADVLEESDK